MESLRDTFKRLARMASQKREALDEKEVDFTPPCKSYYKEGGNDKCRKGCKDLKIDPQGDCQWGPGDWKEAASKGGCPCYEGK